VKVVYLVLALLTSESYVLHKVKFETTLTCDEIHEAVIEFKEIGDRTYPIYKNKVAFAHWCLDEQGNYYLGAEYE
tara:strand:- start:35 stop:259 length:225 start_codon:yes stop_codon:yes gene_type:complete